jgi:hypothetical protein
MGVKYLNSYLKANCTAKSIQQFPLTKYKNKKFAVDTSIYLYRFLSDDALIENMYLLISLFINYDIIPIFIFDGKTPIEKSETILQRRLDRNKAKERYNELMALANNNNPMCKYSNELKRLKRSIVSLKNTDIRNVKTLMDHYGVSYLTSEGEADTLCAELVKTNKVDYCLSDDTDMFLYNCPKILRSISLLHHTVIEYDTSKVFNELNMSYDEFCDVMILSGTDYNNNILDLNILMKEFYRYKDCQSDNTESISFCNWLIHSNYEIDTDVVSNIKNMFCKNNNENSNIAKNIIIQKDTPKYDLLYKSLEKDGFIFYNKLDKKLPWKSSIPV